jgi:hypothetical protein
LIGHPSPWQLQAFSAPPGRSTDSPFSSCPKMLVFAPHRPKEHNLR